MTNIKDLLGQEYKDFADAILIESPFTLITPHHHRVQPVKAAFTRDKLLIAICSEMKKRTSGESCDLEMLKLLPLPFLQISVLDKKNKRIKVELCNKEVIYLQFGEESCPTVWRDWETKIHLLNNRSAESPFTIDPKLQSVAEKALRPKKKVRKKKGGEAKSEMDGQVKKYKKKRRHRQEGKEGSDSDEDAQKRTINPEGGRPGASARRRKTGAQPLFLTSVVKEEGSDEDQNVEHVRIPDLSREAARARWRRLAIQTRFIFRKRKVSFGVSEIFAKAYSRDAKAGKGKTLRRSTSMSRVVTKLSYEQSNDPEFAVGNGSLKKSSSLPLVCEGEATFLEAQSSGSSIDKKNSMTKADKVKFVRYRQLSSVNEIERFRRPSFVPPVESSHDNLDRHSSCESITKVFADVKRQATLSPFKKLFKRDPKAKGSPKKSSQPSPPVGAEDSQNIQAATVSFASNTNITFAMCAPMDSKGRKFNEESLRKDMVTFVLSLKATAVAKELTMIVKKLFFNIPSAELTDCLWTKKDKYKKAPNIMTMIDFFERIANLVATQILYGETVRDRGKLAVKFITIADKCHQLQNFNSLRSILGGLQVTPIYRLDETWHHIMSKHPKKYKTFQELSELMNHEENFVKYRTALEKAMENPPCIPFIGVFLQTVLALDTAKDVSKSKREESRSKNEPSSNSSSPWFARRMSLLTQAKEKAKQIYHVVLGEEKGDTASARDERDDGSDSDHNNNTGAAHEAKRSSSGQRHLKLELFECSDDDMSDDGHKKPAFLQMKPKDMLFHYQIAALPYNFPSDASIREFLLRADYLPDKENYRISLKREPNKSKR